MPEKNVPFTKEELEELSREYPTPFYVYDEAGIRQSARALKDAFSWSPGYKNYFAVKATPNPHILALLKEEGMGADCSSLPELILSNAAGITGEDIMFTSNDTPDDEFREAYRTGGIINLDDIAHIEPLRRSAGSYPDLICFRFNPGKLKHGNSILGNPLEAKYGLRFDQLVDAYRHMKHAGLRRFGLHGMFVSSELDPDELVMTGKILFDTAARISREIGIDFEFINIGGGMGIPYRPEETALDMRYVGNGIRQVYADLIESNGLHAPRIATESGRFVTGPHGYLVTKVRHVTSKFGQFVGTDATMANLMRPGMYGAYHHITVLGKEREKATEVYDVTGSLCENNDKFAVQRLLPRIEPGDLLAIHDAGAHGHSMGFQYNGKLRSPEFLRTNGSYRMIRRGETPRDYFATLDFPGL